MTHRIFRFKGIEKPMNEKNPNIICIGDIHASGFTEDPLVDDLPKRLSYIKKSLNYILKYGTDRGITNYVILGDVYHDKTIIYNISQAMLLEFFNDWCDEEFYIISGNHDLSSTGENQQSAILALNELSNVHCFTEPEFLDPSVEYKCRFPCPAFFVPYSNDFLSSIKKCKVPEKCQLLFSHIGLNEGVLQSGLSKIDKLKLSELNNYKLAILGHYHRPQMLSNDHVTAYYVGSLIPRDWNDKNETKRFLVVNTDTFNVESVDIDCGIPQFVEYVIPPNSTPDVIKDYMEKAKADREKGNIVRVINKNKSKIQDDISDVIILEQQQIDVTNRGITVEQSKMEQCKKYLEVKEIPENEREEYLKVLTDDKLLEVTAE